MSSNLQKKTFEFEQAAEKLKDKAVFAQVDCTQEKELADELNIEGYPTLKLFTHGQFEKDYFGKRKANDMISFVRGSITSPWKVIENESEALQLEIKSRNKDSGCLLIAYSKEEVDQKKFLGLLDKVSKPISVAVDGLNMFYLTTNATLWKAICSFYHVKDNMNDNAILSVRHYPDAIGGPPLVSIQKWTHDNNREEEEMGRFVRGSVFPPLSYLNTTTVHQFKATKLPILVAFIKNVSQMDSQLFQVLDSISKDMLGYVNVVLGDWKSLGSLRRQLSVNDNESDSTAPKVKALKRWVQGVLDGTIEEFRRSEKPPMPNKGVPKIVVGETWHSIVDDSNKDVFILQFAHWLDKSREAEVIVEEIAKELISYSDKLTVAKMNAVDNDAPSPYFAKKYPTMHYFPAGSPKVGIPFESPITRENIMQFIKQHATFPLQHIQKEEL
ncbi:Protein disulfide-isomerase [Galdieria sulphuraria]|nr:Protein disulfide-isomerase [Galdieria sulphuraria]